MNTQNQTLPALWALIREAHSAIAETYTATAERLSAQAGLDYTGWGLLLAAVTFEPQTITPDRLRVRGPYTSADYFHERLRMLAAQGFLAETAPGEFRLTGKGSTFMHGFIAATREDMALADPLPPDDSLRLARLLRKLVQYSLDTPPPPDIWSIWLAYTLMPQPDPPLPYTEQAISCLAAYRDDAHLAAWQPDSLSASELEALSLLWRGDADSLAGLIDRLARRGYPAEHYAQAIQALRLRGFVAGDDAALQVTESGRAFRARVEADTDAFFFAPWECLKKSERDEMAALAARLRDGLRAP
jgi:hypothetical protein